MTSSLNAIKVFLLLLWGVALYSTWYLLLNNGALELSNRQMRGENAQGIPLLPGTSQPVKTHFTGLSAIDNQLALLGVIFWETFDGSMPHGSLFALMFGGQFAAGYSLLLVEGARNGNRNRLIAFTAVWGMLAQNAIFACTVPLYLILHLSTSPTVSSRSARDFSVDIASVSTIPLSMVLGFVVPAALMALPSPSILNYEQKQNFMAIWQVFPLVVALLQQVLKRTIPFLSSLVTNKNKKSNSIRPLRLIYISAFILAGVPRVATMTLIAMSTLFPTLFAPEYKGVFGAARVLRVASVTPAEKMTSIGDGNLQLLQYDEMISNFALIVWAATLYLRVDPKERGVGGWLGLILRAVGVWAVAGPVGVTILCVWGRDEIVFAREDREHAKAA